jgi:hypothetical protein
MQNENHIRLNKYSELTETLMKIKETEKQLQTVRNSFEEVRCKLGYTDKATEFDKMLFQLKVFLNDEEDKILQERNDVWWELQTEFHKTN